MSINGMMRTSVSGMDAQSRRLGAVSSNIANASTVGYKAASAQFASLLIDTPSNTFASGGVDTSIRYDISQQGVLSRTNSMFDLAVSGEGFLVVRDSAGKVTLTRAGAFVPDSSGHLVNSSGFTLLGRPVSGGGFGAFATNGTSGLEPVVISHSRLEAVPTTLGALVANVPSSASAVALADLPSLNASTSQSSARSSIVVYGNLGEEVTLDIHYTRTAIPGEWEVSVFDAAGRGPSGSFPYASGPIAQTALTFDSAGQLDASSPTSISLSVPGGAAMDLDLTGTSQLATGFSVRAVTTNGNPPNDASAFEIDQMGVVYEIYANGTRRAAWEIPLATTVSPDRMMPRSGNVFDPTSSSGDLRIGAAGQGGLGAIVSGALEASTVDLSSELTDMIEAQRNYTANSRVFQTGAELMEILVNLKR